MDELSELEREIVIQGIPTFRPRRAALLASAAVLAVAAAADAAPLKVLFIGNSYTQQVVGSPTTRNHDLYGGGANQIIGDQYLDNDSYTSAFEGFVETSAFAELNVSGALTGGTHGSQTIAYGGLNLWGHLSDRREWNSGSSTITPNPLLYDSISAGAGSNLLGASYNWDVIVLQEFSSVPAFAAKNGSTDSSYRNMWQGVFGTDNDTWGGATGITNGIGEYIATHHSDARVVLYNPWARRSGNAIYQSTSTPADKFVDPQDMQTYMNAGYDLLKQWMTDAGLSASLVDIARVGDGFAAAYSDPLFTEADLLGDDLSSHPTRIGEYLAGAILFETIFGQSSMGLNFDYYGMTALQQARLQQIATSITGVPEPASVVLILIGGAMAATRRRRQTM